jgi:HD-GYP domain-containing protein (c-di-GMP phosphodiesterase class II)
MMTALPDYRHAPLNSLSDKVIARLPESAFGNTEWVTMTTRTAAEHLRAAIASNRPYRIANAVRSMAHAPRLDDVETLASTICETIVSEGYATRCAETIAKVTNARHVINTVISELRGDVEHALPDLARLRESVQGYVQLVGLHDPRLAERLAAVGAFGGRIARSMKLPATTVLDIELAGCLHDVGMIGRQKPARSHSATVSKREHEHFRRHAIAGAAFVGNVASLAYLAPIVRSHHERFDGHGYPDGLRGDEIPLPSRIISVAGAFVDLVTPSSQFETKLPHDACRELALRAGSEFDPDVVTATLHLLRYRQRTHRSA